MISNSPCQYENTKDSQHASTAHVCLDIYAVCSDFSDLNLAIQDLKQAR
jgi:hypothetical protein